MRRMGPMDFMTAWNLRKTMLPYPQGGAAETGLEREARMDHGFAPRSGADQKGSGRSRSSMPTTVCKNSVRCWTGACPTCGLISNNSMCPTTRCTTKVTRASVALPARVPLRPVRMFVPAAGGGKIRKSRSAACIRTSGTKPPSLPSFPAVNDRLFQVKRSEEKERAHDQGLIKS